MSHTCFAAGLIRRPLHLLALRLEAFRGGGGISLRLLLCCCDGGLCLLELLIQLRRALLGLKDEG